MKISKEEVDHVDHTDDGEMPQTFCAGSALAGEVNEGGQDFMGDHDDKNDTENKAWYIPCDR